MKIRSLITMSAGLCLCACSSMQRKGEVTIAGRGVQFLSEKGDPLLETGVYAKKTVSAEFAGGYAKGISDQVKREYWSMQDAPAPPPRPTNQEGKINYYKISLPENVDKEGVRRAPVEVTVPITE